MKQSLPAFAKRDAGEDAKRRNNWQKSLIINIMENDAKGQAGVNELRDDNVGPKADPLLGGPVP